MQMTNSRSLSYEVVKQKFVMGARSEVRWWIEGWRTWAELCTIFSNSLSSADWNNYMFDDGSVYGYVSFQLRRQWKFHGLFLWVSWLFVFCHAWHSVSLWKRTLLTSYLTNYFLHLHVVKSIGKGIASYWKIDSRKILQKYSVNLVFSILKTAL